MKKTLAVFAAVVGILLGGCGSARESGPPHVLAQFGDDYYMVDARCVKAKKLSYGLIACYDANGNDLGRSTPIPKEEIYRRNMNNYNTQRKIALWQAYNQELHNIEMERQMRRMNNQLGVINSNIVNRQHAY